MTVRLIVHPIVLFFETVVCGLTLGSAAIGLSQGAASAAIALVFPLGIAAMHTGARLANRDQDAFLLSLVQRALGAGAGGESVAL